MSGKDIGLSRAKSGQFKNASNSGTTDDEWFPTRTGMGNAYRSAIPSGLKKKREPVERPHTVKEEPKEAPKDSVYKFPSGENEKVPDTEGVQSGEEEDETPSVVRLRPYRPLILRSDSEEIATPRTKRKHNQVVRPVEEPKRSKRNQPRANKTGQKNSEASFPAAEALGKKRRGQNKDEEHAGIKSSELNTATEMESDSDKCPVVPVIEFDMSPGHNDSREYLDSPRKSPEKEKDADLSVMETAVISSAGFKEKASEDDGDYDVDEDDSVSTSAQSGTESTDAEYTQVSNYEHTPTTRHSRRKRQKPERFGTSSSEFYLKRRKPLNSRMHSERVSLRLMGRNKIKRSVEQQRSRRSLRSQGQPVDDAALDYPNERKRKAERTRHDDKLLRDAEEAGVRQYPGEYNLRSRGSRDGDSVEEIGTGPKRRYPKRESRSSFALPLAMPMESEVSADEPPRRKKIATSKTSSSEYSGFEPNVYFPVKEVSFDAIGGYAAVKEELKRELLLPFRKLLVKQQQVKTNAGSPETGGAVDTAETKGYFPKGALFWGPPGTGKTFMAKALAYECGKDIKDVPVYIISGAELLTKWVGESESHLRLVFQEAQKHSPSIIFIDELDGLVRRRTTSESDHVNFNMVSTLLTLLNGAIERESVLVIATTNFKDVIDPALIRSGRFDLKIFFPAPNAEERILIMEALTKTWKTPLTENARQTVAANTEGFTGADLDLLCKKARNMAEIAVEDQQGSESAPPEVSLSSFFHALMEVEPSGSAASPGSGTAFTALDGRVRPLVEKQMQNLIEQLITVYPVRMPGYAHKVQASAMWGAFNNGSLMLDYSPVLFLFTDNDPLLLDLVTGALLQQLSLKNQVRNIDFRSSSCVGLSSMHMECQTLLNDRTCIVGLLHFNEACSKLGPDAVKIPHSLFDVLTKRNRYHAPLLIVTSSCLPTCYGDDGLKVFGRTLLRFHVEQPNQDQVRDFFSHLFSSLREIKRESPDGTSVCTEEGDGIRRKEVRRKKAQLTRRMTSRTVDDLLATYQNLSLALWKGRDDLLKTDFFELVSKISGADLNDSDRDSSASHDSQQSSACTSDKEAVDVFNSAFDEIPARSNRKSVLK